MSMHLLFNFGNKLIFIVILIVMSYYRLSRCKGIKLYGFMRTYFPIVRHPKISKYS